MLTWWCENSPVKNFDGIICDGAVRSGKTVSMAVSFVNWAMKNFNERDFALCGKTILTLRRNVINVLKNQCLSLGYSWHEKRADNLITISLGSGDNLIRNYFYTFGGRDESSQDLIQGMTLAGVFFDEVALMPESFVTQAEARCSVENAKLWYNCNPRNPTHWFYKGYIENGAFVSRNFLYLHFTMDDNLTLSDKVKNRYKRMFSGVFYKRNILGQWVTAEGQIYISFSDSNILDVNDWYDSNDDFTNRIRQDIRIAQIGVDFGGNKSSTTFNCTVFTTHFDKMVVVKEERIKEEITPEQLNERFIEFVKACRREYPMCSIAYCDSAEQVLIRGLKNALVENRIPLQVKNAKKGEIIDRIRFGITMFEQHRFYILSSCQETIEAFQNAVWDEDKEDTRLDDGTSNIDSLDSTEYSFESYMGAMLGVLERGG